MVSLPKLSANTNVSEPPLPTKKSSPVALFKVLFPVEPRMALFKLVATTWPVLSICWAEKVWTVSDKADVLKLQEPSEPAFTDPTDWVPS